MRKFKVATVVGSNRRESINRRLAHALIRLAISGFAIGSGSTLTPLPGTTLAINPAGSSNIDIAVSADGKFLYSLNAGTGAVGMFAIQPTTGGLTDLGAAGSLPAGAGLNGIAAN
jgi:6-phosphogluconolactonase